MARKAHTHIDKRNQAFVVYLEWDCGVLLGEDGRPSDFGITYQQMRNSPLAREIVQQRVDLAVNTMKAMDRLLCKEPVPKVRTTEIINKDGSNWGFVGIFGGVR